MMIKKVAQAIKDKHWSDPYVIEPSSGEFNYNAIAKVAIEALKNPTIEVLMSGPDEPYMDNDVWNKMIDAALKE